MDELPKISAEEFVERMRREFEQALRAVAEAVNEAQTGRIIADSEEPVRELFGQLRRKAYEKALQMRVDAAEAAFPPSEGCQRSGEAQQGAAGV